MEPNQKDLPGSNTNDQAVTVDGKGSPDGEPIWCSLSPSCAPPNEPRCFHSLQDLQAHYASCHAFVCPEDGCSCLFSSEHFLHLHRTEMHDAGAMQRKDAGEAIYQCLLEDCGLVFVSPAQRRKHLVQEHGFEQRFFFSVVKYGIGEHLRAWATQTSDSLPSERPQSRTSKTTRTSPTQKRNEDRRQIHGNIISQPNIVKGPTSRSRVAQPYEPSMTSLTKSMSKVFIHARNKNSPGTTSIGHHQRRVFTQNRNASAPDMHGSISDIDTNSTTDEDEDLETEEAGESSPERAGVRFAEEVAIRFLSPVGRRYDRFSRPRGGNGSGPGNGIGNTVRRGGQASRGGGHHSRRTGRTSGAHSDSETSGRRVLDSERRHPGSRGRTRTRNRPVPDRTQQQQHS